MQILLWKNILTLAFGFHLGRWGGAFIELATLCDSVENIEAYRKLAFFSSSFEADNTFKAFYFL